MRKGVDTRQDIRRLCFIQWLDSPNPPVFFDLRRHAAA
jgi:hypothetical protein